MSSLQPGNYTTTWVDVVTKCYNLYIWYVTEAKRAVIAGMYQEMRMPLLAEHKSYA